MKKILFALALSGSCFSSLYAQTHLFKVDNGLTPDHSISTYEEPGTGYVAIGAGTAPVGLDATLSVVNTQATPPSFVLGVINNVTGTWPSPGVSPYSLAVIHSDGDPLHDPAFDLVVDNYGAVGIGAPPAYIFGSRLGVVDNNPTALPRYSACILISIIALRAISPPWSPTTWAIPLSAVPAPVPARLPPR